MIADNTRMLALYSPCLLKKTEMKCVNISVRDWKEIMLNITHIVCVVVFIVGQLDNSIGALYQQNKVCQS